MMPTCTCVCTDTTLIMSFYIVYMHVGDVPIDETNKYSSKFYFSFPVVRVISFIYLDLVAFVHVQTRSMRVVKLLYKF